MRRTLFIALLLVVAAASGGIVYYVRSRQTAGEYVAPQPVSSSPMPSAFVPRVTRYRLGAVPKQFPRSLLPPGTAQAVTARRADQGTAAALTTLSFPIGRGLSDAERLLRATFVDAGWRVASESRTPTTWGVRIVSGERVCDISLAGKTSVQTNATIACTD